MTVSSKLVSHPSGNLKVQTLYVDPAAAAMNDSQVNEIRGTLVEMGINANVKRVLELDRDDTAGLPGPALRALEFGAAVIVDAGPGIGALVHAIPRANQAFYRNQVLAALVKSGAIPNDVKVRKFGPAGGLELASDGVTVLGAELIELTQVVALGFTSMTQAASFDPIQSEKRVDEHIGAGDGEERVLLENQIVVQELGREANAAVFIDFTVGEHGMPELTGLMFEIATKLGLDHFTLRGTIQGPYKAHEAVIRALPTVPLNNMEEVRACLVPGVTEVPNGTYHLFGSRTDLDSRQDDKWGDLTGNSVYSPKGHFHGYDTQRKAGGHILGLTPAVGARVTLIFEPARAVYYVS